MSRPKVYIRADGNSRIGFGHVIRCCALADMLRDDFDCFFCIQEPLPALRDEIAGAGAALVEWSSEDAVEYRLGSSDVCVLDGYGFDTNYQAEARKSGCKLVCIDDIHAYEFLADLIINHAGGIRPTDYTVFGPTRFCLGPEYALLRRPFQEAAAERVSYAPFGHILVCMGGADPGNATLDAVKALSLLETPPDKVRIVIGAGYLHKEALSAFLESSHLSGSEVLSGLGAEDMALAMRSCGICLCSASTTSMEYMCVKGGLFLQKTADNQEGIYHYFIQNGLAFDVVNLRNVSKDMLIDSMSMQEKAFDGRAGERFRSVFNQLAHA